jgi:uncharacterized protein (TIGR02996 family)
MRSATIYLGAVIDGEVAIHAFVDNAPSHEDVLGTPTRCHHAITRVLDRIGCPGVAQFASWAARPVLLAPSDNDLLRYGLGLPLVSAQALKAPMVMPPAPPVEDAAVKRLFDAVYDNPTSDAERMVLADRLQELGEPRGELIALQLARAKTRQPATEREAELMTLHARTWLRPIASCLAAYGFRRGFLASATIDERVMCTAEMIHHRNWITVEELETYNTTIVTSPVMRSLHRLATTPELIVNLGAQGWPLRGLHTIVGMMERVGTMYMQGGIAIRRWHARDFQELRGFEGLRALVLSVEGSECTEGASRFLMNGKHAKQLERLELYANDLRAIEAEHWRRIPVRDPLISIALRSVVDDVPVMVVREHHDLVVQLGTTAPITNWSLLARRIAAFGEGYTTLTIERIGDQSFDVSPLLDAMQAIFPRVELVAAQRWRSL